jgi:amino acid permease
LIAKSAFGAGIIAMPYTVSKLGWVVSLIAYVGFFIINQFTCKLLLKSKNLSRHSNYSTIMYYLWKNSFARIFGSAVICIDNYGICNAKGI